MQRKDTRFRWLAGCWIAFGSAVATSPVHADGPGADLEITVSADRAVASPGEAVHYEIIVRNRTPSSSAEAAVQDVFPSELIDVSWTCAGEPPGSSCGPGGFGDIDDVVLFSCRKCSFGAFPSVRYDVQAVVDPSTVAPTVVSNTAEVFPINTSDPFPGNNISTADISILDIDQTPSLLGPETLVAEGSKPAVASDGGDRFVVVVEDGEEPPGIDVHTFSPAGQTSFQVVSDIAGSLYAPHVAFRQDDQFIVVWENHAGDELDSGIFGRPVDAQGLQGSEFQYSTFTNGEQHDPKVISLDDDLSVAVWDSLDASSDRDVFHRAKPYGIELQINAFDTATQRHVDAARDPTDGGRFVVTWESQGRDGDGYGIAGRLLRPSGDGVVFESEEFLVNSTTTGDQRAPGVAYDAQGRFLVVWHGPGQGANGQDILGQVFDGDAMKVGGELQVNSHVTSEQTHPAVVFSASQRFIVVWESDGQDGDGTGIFGQALFASTVPAGDEFQVNTTTTGDQRNPALAPGSTGGGDFVVLWEDDTPGEEPEVFFQRFRGASLFADGFESGDVCGWTSGSCEDLSSGP